MTIHLLTLFPKIFDSYLNESMIKRAIQNKRVRLVVHDIRDYTKDRHRKVDDKPYGGGPGMVMQAEPIVRAIKKIVKRKNKSTHAVLLSAKGKLYSQKKAREYAQVKTLVLISGHYEGVDERVMKYVDEELSIGEYVLTGGEPASLVVLDSVVRLLPGVLGHHESNKDESHETKGVLEYPHYTRPEIFNGLKVPKVLLSGDHKKISEWREKKRRKL